MIFANYPLRNLCRTVLGASILISGTIGAITASAAGGAKLCTATAGEQFKACKSEVADSFFTRRAICINVGDPMERSECREEAEAERKESKQLCRAQRAGRRDLCASIGEARYDPDFSPEVFDADFHNLTNPNPYRPLEIGNQWQYVGGDETIVIDVLAETKLIDGVTCIVVRDFVEVAGELREDTNDWLAQAKNGDVWYCGEEVKDYEIFEDDAPQLPELIAIDGSFKAGRDGDKAGILMPIEPTPGTVFRQEFSAGNAEDAFAVISNTYRYGDNADLDLFVPQDLAELFCEAGDCVVTRDFSPMDPTPESIEIKYYTPGIGMFFSVHEVTGEGVQLTQCNFDPRCANLPMP